MDRIDYEAKASAINTNINNSLDIVSDIFAAESEGIEIVGRINALRSTEQYQDVLSNYTLLSQNLIVAELANLNSGLEGVMEEVTAEGKQKQIEEDARIAAEKERARLAAEAEAKKQKGEAQNNEGNG